MRENLLRILPDPARGGYRSTIGTHSQKQTFLVEMVRLLEMLRTSSYSDPSSDPAID